MKITLDEHGIAMPDNNIKGFVNNKLAKCADIHTSQMLVVDCIRSHFAKNPPTFPVQWEFYGREVHFDKYLRSADAWIDPRTDLVSEFLSDIICI